MAEEYHPVTCRVCHKVVAWSKTPHSPGFIFCDKFCLSDYGVSTDETRDSLIDELLRAGKSSSEAADHLGITRQRVDQIHRKRIQELTV